MRQSRALQAALGIDILQPNPHVAIEQRGRIRIAEIKEFSQIQQKDDGKFQTLALVNRHQTHRFDARRQRRRGQFNVARGQVFQIAQEAIQSRSLDGAEGARIFGQGVEPGAPPRSVGQSACVVAAACFLVEQLHQIAQRLFARDRAPALEPPVQLAKPPRQRRIVPLRQGPGRFVKRRIRIRQADFGQIVFAQRHERRAQRGGQRQVLPRIVDQAQQRHRVAHFGRFEKGGLRSHRHGNALRAQGVGDKHRPAAHPSHQDRDVAQPGAAGGARGPIEHRERLRSIARPLPDAPGGFQRLGLQSGRSQNRSRASLAFLSVLLRDLIEQNQLDLAAFRRRRAVVGRGAQGVFVAISQSA
ncbi:MAG: hypothetical protein BWZ10_01073 [candidate division BRC1 bacterium ADurb.BinA364]|nr:MAG: hypothetical protein BWZ10_01073 [candidate division BRC1 bacterium ADurb.BinA364]